MAACRLLGISRATLHRNRNRNPKPPVAGPRRPFRHPAQLSEKEQAEVLAVLDSPRFADKSPGQVWAVLLDEGVYLCSLATMYRLLRERGQSGERRRLAVHPAKKKPELEASGPNEVWSWDITKLKGPARGVYYQLYVILDIFSRKVVHFEIWPTETGTLAKEFIQHAIAANGGVMPAGDPCRPPEELPSSQVTRHFLISPGVIHNGPVGGSRLSVQLCAQRSGAVGRVTQHGHRLVFFGEQVYGDGGFVFGLAAGCEGDGGV